MSPFTAHTDTEFTTLTVTDGKGLESTIVPNDPLTRIVRRDAQPAGDSKMFGVDI